MTLKGQHIENIELGILNWLRKSILQIKFFKDLEKKLSLCVYGEYAKQRKSNENKHISVNNKQHKKSFRSSTPTLDRFE